MGVDMSLREEAVNVLCGDDPTSFGPCPVHSQDLDALLDWLDVNAERIAGATMIGGPLLLERDEILRRMVTVLRGKAPDD